MRERRYDQYARVIQKAFCRYFARRQRQKQREQAAGIHDDSIDPLENWITIHYCFIEIVFGKKERRRFSLNRGFVGDYIGLDNQPALRALVGKREKIEFAETVLKYDRRFQVCLNTQKPQCTVLIQLNVLFSSSLYIGYQTRSHFNGENHVLDRSRESQKGTKEGPSSWGDQTKDASRYYPANNHQH